MFGDAERIPQRKREDHTAYCFNCVLSTISFVDAVASEFVEGHCLVEKWAIPGIGVYAAPETTHGVVDGRFY